MCTIFWALCMVQSLLYHRFCHLCKNVAISRGSSSKQVLVKDCTIVITIHGTYPWLFVTEVFRKVNQGMMTT